MGGRASLCAWVLRRQRGEWMVGGREGGGSHRRRQWDEECHPLLCTHPLRAGRQEGEGEWICSFNFTPLVCFKRLFRSADAPTCLPSPSLPSFTLVCMPLAARLRLIDCHRLKPLHSLIHRMMDLYIYILARFLLNRDHRLSESGLSEQFSADGSSKVLSVPWRCLHEPGWTNGPADQGTKCLMYFFLLKVSSF